VHGFEGPTGSPQAKLYKKRTGLSKLKLKTAPEAPAPQAHLLEIFGQPENQPCVLDFKVERALLAPRILFRLVFSTSFPAKRPPMSFPNVLLPILVGHLDGGFILTASCIERCIGQQSSSAEKQRLTCSPFFRLW